MTMMTQFANSPAGPRKSIHRILSAAMLAAVLSSTCMAQAVMEGAQLGKQAPPPVTQTAPPLGAAAPLKGALPPEPVTEPLRTPPPSAGPIQASVVGGGVLPGAFSAITHTPTENNVMHIVMGHQVFIDTKSRLRRVYVADPAVLNSVTLTPNQIVVTAVGPGLSSLTLLDEIGRAQSYMISSDADLSGLRSALEAALSHDHITVEGSGGRVVLTGAVATQADSDAAAKLAGMYAKEVVNALNVAPGHPKQVRLQVRILEVDRNKAQQFGVNLFQTAGANTSWTAATTTTQYPSTLNTAASATGLSVIASNPLNFFLYSARANFGATIQDLQTKQVLQILAEPTITTISGEKGQFLAGGEFPIPVAQPGSAGSAAVITVQWRQYGVKLEFTPIVNPDDTIRLTVEPEVSALDYTNAVTLSGATIPAISTRRASTQVELRSDQSFAISGLLDQRTTDLMNKNPGVASIPILGELFKSKNVTRSATELVVVVTPSVVDPLSDTTEPVQPGLPIPTLDRPGFDASLGKNLNPRPAAPSLDPHRPPFGDAVPAPLPPNPNSPDGRIVGDAAPLQQNEPAQPQPAQTLTTPSVPTNVQASPNTSQVSAPQPAVKTGEQVPAAQPATTPATSKPAADPSGAKQGSVSLAPAIAANTQPASTAAQTGKPTVVEIMALSHESDADATLSALRRHGYNPSVNHTTQDSLLHLDLGPFPTRMQAEAMRQRLVQDGYDATLK